MAASARAQRTPPRPTQPVCAVLRSSAASNAASSPASHSTPDARHATPASSHRGMRSGAARVFVTPLRDCADARNDGHARSGDGRGGDACHQISLFHALALSPAPKSLLKQERRKRSPTPGGGHTAARAALRVSTATTPRASTAQASRVSTTPRGRQRSPRPDFSPRPPSPPAPSDDDTPPSPAKRHARLPRFQSQSPPPPPPEDDFIDSDDHSRSAAAHPSRLDASRRLDFRPDDADPDSRADDGAVSPRRDERRSAGGIMRKNDSRRTDRSGAFPRPSDSPLCTPPARPTKTVSVSEAPKRDTTEETTATRDELTALITSSSLASIPTLTDLTDAPWRNASLPRDPVAALLLMARTAGSCGMDGDGESESEDEDVAVFTNDISATKNVSTLRRPHALRRKSLETMFEPAANVKSRKSFAGAKSFDGAFDAPSDGAFDAPSDAPACKGSREAALRAHWTA